MATATHAARFEQRRNQNELKAEVEHVNNLVRLRSLLERFGSTKTELRSYDAEIARHRRALAAVTGHSGQELSAA